MADKQITTKFVADIESFNNSVTTMSRKLGGLQRQLEVNKQSLDSNGASTEILSKRKDLLGKKIETLKTQMVSLRSALSLTGMSEKENIKIKDKYKSKIAETNVKLQEAKNEYNATTKAIKDYNLAQKESTKNAQDTAKNSFSGYAETIKEINNKLIVLQSQLKANKTEFDKNGDVIGNLSQRSSLLAEKIEVLKTKIQSLQSILNTDGINTKENARAKEKYQNELAKTEGKLRETEAEYNKTASTMQNYNTQLEEMEAGEQAVAANNFISKVQAVGSAIKASLQSIGNNISKVVNAFKSLETGLTNIGRRSIGITKKLKTNFIDKAIGYAEELNLFNVVFKNLEKDGETTFSKIGLKATQFQNKLNEAFGTNKMESMRYQGLYQSMSQSAGLSPEVANLISENMTKLGYDLASLFNTTEQKAMESLRAGVFAGQTKPLRGYGIDVTQQTYKPVLADLGIDKRVSELSQAEKEVLRYIVAIKQASSAHGDFADTIESPANQLKVLRNQLVELSVAIGNYFIAPFQRALQVINGVIMALKELADFFARLMGIDVKQFNSGYSYNGEYEEQANDIDDIGDSASGTTKKLKELQRQVLGFDQINNITSPTDTGGTGGSGSSGGNYGIDDRLLNALQGYDSYMDKIRMKASEIRDLIMKWLGFKKDIDPKTQETFFTYDDDGKSTREVAREMAQNLATNLNKFLDDIDWEELGRKLGYKITIILTGINQFIQTFDWKALGEDLASYLNGLISEIDPVELGQTLTDKFRVAILTFSGFVQKFDFKQFAHKLARTINAAIKNIPIDELINGINALVNGIFDAISILLKEIDWGELIDSIMKIISNLDWKAKLLILGSALASGITSLLSSSIIKSAITKGLGDMIAGAGGSGGLASIFTTAKGAALKFLPVLGKIGLAIGGTVTSLKGMGNLYDLAYDVGQGKETAGLKTTGRAAGGAAMAAGGGAVVGTLIAPGIGTAIGALVGALGGLIAEVKGYHDAMDDLAYSNVFGDISISFEEWKEKISKTITPISDMKSKLTELQSKQENLYEAMTIGQEKIGLYTEKFRIEAKKLNGEDGEAFLGALTIITDNAKQIIKDGGDYNLQVMSDMFKNTSALTEEEEKNVLAKLIENNDKKQEQIDKHSQAVKDIYEKARKEKRAINDKEYEDIQEHLKKINDLTVTEMSQTQADVEYLKQQAIDNNGKLDEESYKRFNDALEDFYSDQMDIISGNYTTQLNALQKNKDDGILKEDQYDKQLKAIQEDRRKKEEELQTKIKDYRSDVYSDLVTKYNDVMDKTDSISKKEKELIEGTFENVNFDTTDLFKEMGKAGKDAASKFSSQFNSNVSAKIKNITINPSSEAQKDLNLKRSYKLPVDVSARGGIYSKGSLILAGEMGSEIVGSINGRTEVMNQSQIAETIYRAVKSAMKESDFGGGVDIQLHTDEGVIVDRINKITRQTGTCPIRI